MTFGTTLRKQRERRQMPQSVLADLSGVSQATVSSWESDLTKPTVDDLKRLAKALEIPAATFFEENPAIKLVQNNKEQNQQNQAIVNQYNYDSERKVWEELDKSRRETIAAQQDVIEALKLALGLRKDGLN